MELPRGYGTPCFTKSACVPSTNASRRSETPPQDTLHALRARRLSAAPDAARRTNNVQRVREGGGARGGIERGRVQRRRGVRNLGDARGIVYYNGDRVDVRRETRERVRGVRATSAATGAPRGARGDARAHARVPTRGDAMPASRLRASRDRDLRTPPRAADLTNPRRSSASLTLATSPSKSPSSRWRREEPASRAGIGMEQVPRRYGGISVEDLRR